MDGTLSALVWREVSLPGAGSWNYVILKVPFNPNHPMILWKFTGPLNARQSHQTSQKNKHTKTKPHHHHTNPQLCKQPVTTELREASFQN